MFCGWCTTGHCCEGRVPDCEHTRRCTMLTEKQRAVAARTAATAQRVFADLRQGRTEVQMMKQIEKAWEQLDVAVEEIARLQRQIQGMKEHDDHALAATFAATLAEEKAKARGKAEILALLMPAPLNSPEAVSRESGRRYMVRQAGRVPETPGLRAAASTLAAGIPAGRLLTDEEYAEKYQ